MAPPTESLDFSDQPPDPFGQLPGLDPFAQHPASDPFAQSPSSGIPTPTAPQPYYRAPVAAKENKKAAEEHVPLSMDVMYVAAGAAFVVGLGLTLVLGIAML